MIPIIGLGAMYILSNEDKKNKLAENQNKQLNNTNKLYSGQINNSNNNSKQLLSSNQHTDKFFNENNYLSIQHKDNKNIENNHSIKSLSGNNIEKDEFTHNNMVPFFGSKIRGGSADNQISQSILDNKQGAGSQQFKKKESAPLFSPNDNLHNTYGMQNHSDFFQSRMNNSNNMANVSLWEQKQVTPGLNLNYDENTNLGFNNGMDAREIWKPKDVNELRVDNNPKISYDLAGHEGPANNLVKEMGSIGKVEKHLPDKFYNNDPSRWITTTGLEKAQTQRAELILQDQNRQNTTAEYYGNSGNTNNLTYANQNYEDSKRINLGELPISNASAVGRANNDTKNSYCAMNNNRSTTQDQLDFGPVGGLAQAILTPIMDIIRPTRKENVIGNLRENGNVSNIINNGYLLNKNDKPGVTNREMYSKSINHLNVQGQNGDGYLVNKPEILSNQRETTSVNYISNGANTNFGFKSNEAVYNQRNNNNKTQELRPNQGGTQIFNQYMNVSDVKNDNDRNNNRMWVSNGGPKMYNNTMLAANCDRGLQTYDQKINNDRMNPDLLSAFKQNPYTQSLHSVA